MSHTAQPAPAEPALAQVGFVAMGSDIHIVAVGATPDALRRAAAAVRMLDHRWSRFRPDSEVSRINAAAGRTTRVSTATTTLVALAVRGWRATDGTYDPTILDALVAAGYDRSFDRIDDADRAHGDVGTPSGPAPGCAGITVDGEAGTVRVPAGVRLDPGGIGKGLAADLVAARLLTDGAAGALVNVGGDIRVAGASPAGGRRVAVDVAGPAGRGGSTGGGDRQAPRRGAGLELTLRAGAVATSSTRRRTWIRDGTERHHLIDPATGAPAATVFVAATVVAGSAWWAEVLTKAVLLADSEDTAERTLSSGGGGALVADRAGRVHRLAGIDRFLR